MATDIQLWAALCPACLFENEIFADPNRMNGSQTVVCQRPGCRQLILIEFVANSQTDMT